MPSPPLTMDEQQPTIRKEPHWFVQRCMQTLGANMDSLNDRLDSPLTVLVLLGPLAWLRVAAMVC